MHRQEFFTVHTAVVYVIQVCWQLASRIRTEQAVSKPVWHIPLLCVQWKTPDDGQRNYPKHVEFYSKNKFAKLVHLVGFIIRIILPPWPRCTNFSPISMDPARPLKMGPIDCTETTVTSQTSECLIFWLPKTVFGAGPNIRTLGLSAPESSM